MDANKEKEEKMKVLLMTLNSKYIHSNLAIHSIAGYINKYASEEIHEDVELVLKEFTINNTLDDTLREMVEISPDVIMCSTYIWNIEPLCILFSNFKKLNQKSILIFGGPEVTYETELKMKKYPFMDIVMRGEGERTALKLLETLHGNSNKGICLDIDGLIDVKGIAYKSEGVYIQNPVSEKISPLDEIPFVYDDFGPFENRILYYESSRGCPYNCSYCLSAAEKEVRYYTLDRVYADLDVFLKEKVSQVKFVDRTFNIKKEHSLAILKYLVENDNGITNFHFEITATLLDEAYFEVLKEAREGLFQFEIGVQSTCLETMTAINRPIPFEVLSQNVKRLHELNNIHLHLDLIAGLPHEGFSRFLKSFDEVFGLRPHDLQLGFLKLLDGTPIMNEIDLHGYQYREQAPYEVLYNAYISFEELTVLKNLETILEYFYNSGKFKHALSFLMKRYQGSSSQLFLEIVDYFKKRDILYQSHSGAKLYDLLYEFYCEFDLEEEGRNVFSDLLKFDYYYSNMKGQRSFFKFTEIPKFNLKRMAYLKDEEVKQIVNTNYCGMPVKQILKTVEFITLTYDIMSLIESDYTTCTKVETVVLFDYLKGSHSLEPSNYYRVILPEDGQSDENGL